MNICLLSNHSCSNPLNLELARITTPNHVAYAQRHGYTQHIMRMDWEPSKLGWLKTLKFLLPQFDMVLGHGIDTLFMNQSITVEEVATKAGHKCGVMFAKEAHTEWPVNNDVSIWWNDQPSMAIIDRMIEDFEIWRDMAWIWQNHIWNLLQTEKHFSKWITLTTPRNMNASPGGDNEARWKVGDWLCHFLGHNEFTKIPIAKVMLKKVSADGSYHGPTTTYRRIKRLSKRDPNLVVLAMPNYEGMSHMETFNSTLFALIRAANQESKIQFVKLDAAGTQVPRLRDILLYKARTFEFGGRLAGRIGFIDADMIFTLEHLLKMAMHQAPVVGALYPKKQAPFDWCFTPIPGKGTMSNGLQECVEIGTGFKFYDLDVFDAIIEENPQTEYEETLPEFRGKTLNFIFHDQVVDRHRDSEDYTVDRMWRNMGGIVYADTSVKVGHMMRYDALQLKQLGERK